MRITLVEKHHLVLSMATDLLDTSGHRDATHYDHQVSLYRCGIGIETLLKFPRFTAFLTHYIHCNNFVWIWTPVDLGWYHENTKRSHGFTIVSIG